MRKGRMGKAKMKKKEQEERIGRKNGREKDKGKDRKGKDEEGLKKIVILYLTCNFLYSTAVVLKKLETEDIQLTK